MKKLGVKRYITIIWLLLTTITISSVGLLIYNTLYKTPKPHVEVDAEWELERRDGGDGDFSDNYNNNSVFTISAFSTLQYFANTVNSGYSYSGKTVKLLADINCGWNSIGIGSGLLHSIDGSVGSDSVTNSFDGIFDGCGHTISNVSYTSKFTHKSGQIAGWFVVYQEHHHYSLFNVVGSSAQIKNLRVYNCGRSDFSGGDFKYIAGIVGRSLGATISNCMVENFSVSTKDETSRITIAGIVAYGSATLINCHVKNITATDCGSLFGLTYHGKAESCIVQKLTKGYVRDFYEDFTKGTATNCHTTAKTTTGLNCSSSTGPTGTTWFYYEYYNDSYPYLRNFIDWRTFYFDCDGDGSYETSRSVASDYTIDPVEDVVKKNLSWQPVVVPMNENVSYQEKPGFVFDGWEIVDDYHFKVKYRQDCYRAMFMTPKNGNEYVVSYITYLTDTKQLTGVGVDDFYTVQDKYFTYNDTITVSVRYTSASTIVTYNIGEITGVYTINGIYELDNYGTLGNNGVAITNNMKVPDLNNLTGYFIRPILKLKSYNTQFG